MSRLVHLNGDIRGIVGLDWDSMVSAAWKNKRKAIKSARTVAVASFPVDSQDGETLVNYGTTDRQAVIQAREVKSEQMVSLAGLLALSNPRESICVLERPANEDELIWFCLSQNGQVVTGTDVIGTFDEILSVVETYRDLIEDGMFIIAGNAADIFDPTVDGANVRDLLEYANGNAAALDVGKEGIGVIGLTLVIGGFVSVCLLGYYALWGGDTGKRPDLSPAEAAEIQRESARNTLNQKVHEIEQSAELHGTMLILNHLIVRYMPKQIGGWSMTKARCMDKRCQFEFQNTDWAPVSLIAHETEGLCELAVTANGEAAVCTVKYETASLVDSVSDKGDWLLPRTAMNDIRSRLMEIAARSNSSSFNIDGPHPIDVPGIHLLTDERTMAHATFTLNTGLINVDETMAILGDGAPIALRDVVYDFGNGVVQVKADFYIEGE